MKTYKQGIFLSGPEDFEFFFDKSTNESGMTAFFDADDETKMDFLLLYDIKDSREEVEYRAPWGSADTCFEKDGVVLSYNIRMGYAGLCFVEEKAHISDDVYDESYYISESDVFAQDGLERMSGKDLIEYLADLDMDDMKDGYTWVHGAGGMMQLIDNYGNILIEEVR